MRRPLHKAFTLVEILIVVVILGILTAIVVPQFAHATQDAQVGNIQTQLQTIRAQIELFKVNYNGYPPSLVGVEDASFSDLLAAPRGEKYLVTLPMNPHNRRNEVVEDPTPVASAAAGPSDPVGAGWFFNSTAGVIAAAGFDESTNQWVP